MLTRRLGKKFSESLGDGGGGSMLPKVITVPSDYPTTEEANKNIGRFYIGAGSPSVVDNDTTKTDTGFVLLLGSEAVWNGTTYVEIGAQAIWLIDVGNNEVRLITSRDLNLQTHGLKDATSTSTIKLTSAVDPALVTDKKSIAGGINEAHDDAADVALGLVTHEGLANPHSGSASTANLNTHIGFPNPHSGSAASGVNTDITKLLNALLLRIVESAEPASPVEGDIYKDIITKKYRFFENGAWIGLGATDIWQKITGVVSLISPATSIDFSNAGLILNALFSAGSIPAYDSLPTLISDLQVVHKKYVDDKLQPGGGQKDVIPVGTLGQKAFPAALSQTPTNLNTALVYARGQFFDYGYGFILGGVDNKDLTWLEPTGADGPVILDTDDRFVIIYNYNLGSVGILQQDQVLLYSVKGNDSNDGSSEEQPFLTIPAALTDAASKATSIKPFVVRGIDAGTYSSAATIPSYVILDAKYSKITGTTTLAVDSEFHFNNIYLELSQTSVLHSGAGGSRLKGRFAFHNFKTGATFIEVNNGGTLYATVDEVNLNYSTAKTYALTNGSTLYLYCKKYTLETNSTVDATSNAYIITPNAIYKNNVKIFDTLLGYPQTNLPSFRAEVSTLQANVTGDDTSYPVVADNVSTNGFYNRGGAYNVTNGRYKAEFRQIATFGGILYLGGSIQSSHSFIGRFIRRGSGGTEIPGTQTDFMLFTPIQILGATNTIIFGGHTQYLLEKDDTVELQIQGLNGGKTISVYANKTIFYGSALTAVDPAP